MILSGNTIKRHGIIKPHLPRSLHEPSGTTFGQSVAGYDIRLDQNRWLVPGRTVLGSSMEYFRMPNNVVGIVHDKSTWARRGVFVQNTVIEPGWDGFLTLEFTYNPVLTEEDQEIIQSGKTRMSFHTEVPAMLVKGSPIAQVVFHYTDEETEGYGNGKYQNQERGPQYAR